MSSARRTALATALFLGVVSAATPAAAAPPDIERIPIQATFPEEFLTEACGVPVTATLSGVRIVRTFEDDGVGVLDVSTVNIAVTLQSEDNSIRIRDVGADVVRRTPDDTVILSISGQVPFFFKGVLKIDLETGEAIFEPKDWFESDVQRVCEALTA
jgi:hypothetical protein